MDDTARANAPRFDLPRIGLWAALLLALFGTLGNAAWTFSTVDSDNLFNGYIKAIAVDVGMIALAAHIQQRKRIGQHTWPVWVGAFAFAGVSIYANYLHGVAHTTPLNAPGAEFRPQVLAAILPLILLYLVEIVSHAPAKPQSETQKETLETHNPHGETHIPPLAPQPVAVTPVELHCPNECGRTFRNQQALAGHLKACNARMAAQPVAVATNGNGAH